MTEVTPSASGPDLIVTAADGTLLSARRLGEELAGDVGFQFFFPTEVTALQDLDLPSLAAPVSYLRDASGRVAACLRRHVAGMRLSDVLKHHPRGLDSQTTTVIAWDVLTALAALHARGIGHRAVTAENVIVDTAGVCVLVDVGLAPRPAGQTLDSLVATDLTWFADLITLCLAGGPAGRRRRDVPPRMGAWLPRTLPEPLRPLLRSVLSPGVSAASASAALADLSIAAVRQFEYGWDARARERLLTACWVATTSAAAPPVRHPAARAAPRGTPTRHRETRPVRRVVIALALVGAGLATGVNALTAGHPTVSRMTAGVAPKTSIQSTAPFPVPAASSSGSAPVVVPTPTPTLRNTPTTVPTPPTMAARPMTTAVTRLTIIEIGYSGAYQVDDLVIVEVATSGTGRVLLVLDVPARISYPLQGRTSYLVTAVVPDSWYCSLGHRAITASTIPGAAVTQHTRLFFPRC